MILKNSKILFIVLLAIFSNLYAKECIVVMGYKEKAKEPYILKDDSGLYKDLYTQALKNIGCTLKIKRASKKRILAGLKKGSIDFYPGFNFSSKRSQNVVYIKNGLPKDFAIITRSDSKDFHSKEDLKKSKFINIVELGGVNLLSNLNLRTVELSELTLQKAVMMIQRKRADVYAYNKDQIDYYIKKYKPKNIKIHNNIYKNSESLYLAFSQKSQHIDLNENKEYNAHKTKTLNNVQYILDKNCLAYKLQLELLKLKQNGFTNKLYNKYFN